MPAKGTHLVEKVQRVCQCCGQTFEAYPSLVRKGQAKYCAAACKKAAQVGKPCPKRKGGGYRKNGYVMVHRPDHPAADAHGHIFEHRVVMEQKLGRLLRRGEVVHHRNGKRDDNRAENLELTTQAEHVRHHNYARGRLRPAATDRAHSPTSDGHSAPPPCS